jgi:hypothetical protein
VEPTDPGVEHEQGLALFISPEWRARFRESLSDDRRRQKLLNKLHHFRHLDMRFANEVPSGDQRASIVGARLRERGAPRECHALSNDADLDGRDMDLDEALSALLDRGSCQSTFIFMRSWKAGLLSRRGSQEPLHPRTPSVAAERRRARGTFTDAGAG